MDGNTSASSFFHQAEVALFRAVRGIPFDKLKDIICMHYGARNVTSEWRRVQTARRDLTGGNNNLYLYLSITNRLGRKNGAIEHIMTVYNDITRMVSAASSGDIETFASQQTPPLMEPADPSTLGDATIEQAKAMGELNDVEDVNDYLEAFKCNTTRSCYLDTWDLVCHKYSGEDDSLEDSGDGSECSKEEVRETQFSVTAPVDSEETQGEEGGRRGILEDDTVDRPKVIIDDE